MRYFLWTGFFLLLIGLAACASDPQSPGDPTEGVEVVVDPALQPVRNSLPPFEEGGPVRPVASSQYGDDAFQADFVANEVIVRAEESALGDFLAEWNGEIVRRIEPDGEVDIGPSYVVRIDPTASQAPSLNESLLELSPSANGRLRVSTQQGVDLIAAAAAATIDGVKADLNWLASSHQAVTFEGRVTQEHEIAPGSYDNAFDESYMQTTGNQRTGVGDAWLALERAGRLNNKVTIGVIDGGFSINNDFPASVQSFAQGVLSDGLDVPNPTTCTGGTPCPWHGTGSVGAAMGRPNNSYGGAGPAGPVANAITVLTQFTSGSTQWALGRLASRAFVINMSFGGSYSGTWAWWTIDDYAEFVRDVFRNGNFMVASAGNDDVNVDAGESPGDDPTIHAPCEFVGVTCVGALKNATSDRIDYSNYAGSNVQTGVYSDGTVDIYAPTNITVGEYPNSPSTNTFGGTSAASPFTAGIVALIKAADPSLSFFDVRNVLVLNANTGSSDPDVDRWVNALDSVLAALNSDSPPRLQLDQPLEGATFPEDRTIQFSATVDDLDTAANEYDIKWTYDREGVPFTFGTTKSEDVESLTPFCDGTWEVTAEARHPTTGAVATDSVTVTITNPASSSPPARCAPSVEIIEPSAGSTFAAGTPVSFSARIDDDHPETDDPIYPVEWRLDGPTGFVFGRGLDVQRTFTNPTNQTVVVDYGGATDSVTFNVIQTTNDPPTASINSPNDGATIVDFSTIPNVTVAVSGTGFDPEDGQLTGSSLAWSYRKAGSQTWIQAGGGNSRDLTLQDNTCFGDTTYDVRLTATDSEGLSDSVIIEVNVRGYLC
jgi:hypothetical protein